MRSEVQRETEKLYWSMRVELKEYIGPEKIHKVAIRLCYKALDLNVENFHPDFNFLMRWELNEIKDPLIPKSKNIKMLTK